MRGKTTLSIDQIKIRAVLEKKASLAPANTMRALANVYHCLLLLANTSSSGMLTSTKHSSPVLSS